MIRNSRDNAAAGREFDLPELVCVFADCIDPDPIPEPYKKVEDVNSTEAGLPLTTTAMRFGGSYCTILYGNYREPTNMVLVVQGQAEAVQAPLLLCVPPLQGHMAVRRGFRRKCYRNVRLSRRLRRQPCTARAETGLDT